MRFFLLICLIFFSFTLKAQQATFKVKKENDNSFSIPNVTLHFPDSENDSSIFAAWRNNLTVKSKQHNIYIIPSTNAILSKVSDSSYTLVTRGFENKVDLTIYFIDNNDTIFVKSETRNVSPLPNLTTFFGKYTIWNNLVVKNDIKSINKLEVRVPGLNLKGYKVESFRMIVSTSNKIYISSSEFLTSEMMNVLKTLKKGDEIIFSNIKVSRDGKTRDMPILELLVN
jgi:exosome complex RNA-binding protein Csl4